MIRAAFLPSARLFIEPGGAGFLAAKGPLLDWADLDLGASLGRAPIRPPRLFFYLAGSGRDASGAASRGLLWDKAHVLATEHIHGGDMTVPVLSDALLRVSLPADRRAGPITEAGCCAHALVPTAHVIVSGRSIRRSDGRP